MKTIFTSLVALMILTILLAPSVQSGISQSLSAEKYEVALTIRAPSDITSGTTLADVKFPIDYEVTFFSMPTQQANVNIPTGLVGCATIGEPTNISIADNLGNTFDPLIQSSGIANLAKDNIIIPANFQYKLTLRFSTIGDCYFLNDSGTFGFGYMANQTGTTIPMTITFRIPNNYQMILSAEGADKQTDEQYNNYVWTTSSKNVAKYLMFLPFITTPTVRSLEVRTEALSASPDGGIQETLKMTYDAVGTVMIWNITLNYPIYIPFPSNISGCEVISVRDGQGELQARTDTINPDKIDPSGKYYVDNLRRVVIIYPRSTYQDITQRFDLQITFQSPNNAQDSTIKADIPLWQPYKGYTGLDFIFNSKYMTLNLTGNLKIMFVLPEGYDSLAAIDSDKGIGGLEDNKPTITFNYNSPINLPKEQWIITFDRIVQRDLFVSQIVASFLSFAALIAIIVVSVKTTKTKKVLLALLPTLAPITLVIKNITDFAILGWFDALVIGLIAFQICLSVLIVYFMWRYYEDIPAL